MFESRVFVLARPLTSEFSDMLEDWCGNKSPNVEYCCYLQSQRLLDQKRDSLHWQTGLLDRHRGGCDVDDYDERHHKVHH